MPAGLGTEAMPGAPGAVPYVMLVPMPMTGTSVGAAVWMAPAAAARLTPVATVAAVAGLPVWASLVPAMKAVIFLPANFGASGPIIIGWSPLAASTTCAVAMPVL